MKLQFFKKEEMRTNVDMLKDVMQETEKTLKGIFKAAGVDPWDALDLDEETGAAYGIACQGMKRILEISLEAAERADKMEAKFAELQTKTDAIMASNQMMIGMLKDLQKAKK